MDHLQSVKDLPASINSETLNLENHVFLDTKNVCFFCLEENNIEPETHSKPKPTSLQNICKYLNINTVSNKIFKQDENRFLKNKCNISVLLCSRCAGFSQSLSLLIQKLDIIQLHILHNLQLLQGVFCDKGRYFENDGEWDQVEAKMGFGSENLRKSMFLKLLRNELKQKCAVKLTEFAQPKVRINQLNRQITDSNESELNLSKLNKLFDKFATSIAANSADNNPTLLLHRVVRFCRKIKNPVLTNKLNIYCPLCKGLVCNSTFHFLHAHMDKIFQAEKLPNTSHETFNSYCKQVISTLINRKIPAALKHREGNQRYVNALCSVCRKSCNGYRDLKSHIVMTHYKTISRKLKDLQELPKISNEFSTGKESEVVPYKNLEYDKTMLYKLPIKSTEISSYTFSISTFSLATCFKRTWAGEFKKSYQCQICHGCTHSSRTREHLVHNHLQMFFQHQKQPDMPDEEFQEICKSLLLAETRFSILSPEGAKVKCGYCDSEYSNKTLLKYHLITMHHSKMDEKVACWLRGENLHKNRSTVDEILVNQDKIVEEENTTEEQNDTEEFVRKRGKPNKPVDEIIAEFRKSCIYENGKLQCPVCKAIFASVSNISQFRAHLINQHPELIFSKLKSEHVTQLQFQDICTSVIEDGLKKNGVNGRHPCSYCTLSFNRKRGVTSHAISVHFEILKEKLVKAQKKVKTGLWGTVKPIESAFVNKTLDKICNESRKNNQLICGVAGCNKIYKEHQNSTRADEIFKRHTGDMHPELLFESVKCAKVSYSQFRYICVKVLKTEMDECGKTLMCRHCQHPNKHKHLHLLKLHLELYHFDLLKEKIIKAQTSWEERNLEVRNKPCPQSRKRKLEGGSGDNIEIQIEREDEMPVDLTVIQNVDSTIGESNDAVPIVKQEVIYEHGNMIACHSLSVLNGDIGMSEIVPKSENDVQDIATSVVELSSAEEMAKVEIETSL